MFMKTVDVSEAPRRGRGELVLYLDFDGVLHHENCLYHPRKGPYLCAPAGHTLFQHVPLLQELLFPYPDVRIVLSTSWVRRYGFRRTARLLGPSLCARAIGTTFHSRMDEQEFSALARGMQVCGDVYRRRPRDWMALDDDAQDWPEGCIDKLVHTDGVMGIGVPEVMERIREKLAVMCRANLHKSG